MSNPTDATVRVQLVNEANRRYGLSMQVGDVQFSAPVIENIQVVDLLNPTLRNSNISITAGNPLDNGIVVNVKYNRLYLPKVCHQFSLNFIDQGELDVLSVLPRLALRLGLTLESTDFLTATFLESGAERTAVLAASSDSLVYFGQVEIVLSSNPDWIETVEGQPLETVEGMPLLIEI